MEAQVGYNKAVSPFYSTESSGRYSSSGDVTARHIVLCIATIV